MPQLKSGRRVFLSVSPYLDAISSDNEDSAYFAMVALRIHASTPEDLLQQSVIGEFAEGEPFDRPGINTSHCVADILEGRSDWSANDIDVFREFLDAGHVRSWIAQEYDALSAAIHGHPVWQSSLHQGFEDSEGTDAASLKRLVIYRSARDPAAMAELRQFRPDDSPTPSTTSTQAHAPPPLSNEPPTRRRKQMPAADNELLVDLILAMASRDDVHSVSCQFGSERLWRGLMDEQIKRARLRGKRLRDAFFLCGPDSGIRGIAKHYPAMEDKPEEYWFDGSTLEEKMGGEIHIPLEGVCGADLFVYPDWRRIYPEEWKEEGATLDWATAGKPCNLLLIERDLGDAPFATRIGPIAGTWWLYSSAAPYKNCNPFHQDPIHDIVGAPDGK